MRPSWFVKDAVLVVILAENSNKTIQEKESPDWIKVVNDYLKKIEKTPAKKQDGVGSEIGERDT